MIWSVSSGKQFERCPRQWYYKNIVANAKVKKDPYRREVTLLSKVKSIDAWRGNIVDNVISRKLIYGIKNKYTIRKDYYIAEALKEFESQLTFAKSKKYRVEGFNFSDDDEFAALFPFEFNEEIDDKRIQSAKDDVISAITLLVENQELIEYLKSATTLISQRPLTFKFNRFTVRGVPDLLAFFDNQPPHILDWKVHTFGTKAYDEQLITYAIALNNVIRIKAHKDFPENAGDFKITDYKLTEWQLLQPKSPKRNYGITDESIETTTNKISTSILSIYMNGGHLGYDMLKPEMFSTTYYPNNCPSCPFKKLCKQHENEIRNRRIPDLESKRSYVQLSLM